MGFCLAHLPTGAGFRNHPEYPLVNTQKAIEHGPVEIVDFPIKNGDFSIEIVEFPMNSMVDLSIVM